MATDAIRLPIERTDQIRALATHFGLTIGDLIANLVKNEINRLGLSAKIGLGATVDIAPLEDGTVHVDIADVGLFQWAPTVATGVSDAIDVALARKGSTLDVDAGVEISRVGTSIKLRNIETREERAFAPNVAQDLADLIRSAAN